MWFIKTVYQIQDYYNRLFRCFDYGMYKRILQRKLKNIYQFKKTFRIVNGTASRFKKYFDSHVLLMMRRNKINLSKLLECKQLKQKNEIKEFCMLWFSRLVECKYLNEAKEFVMHGFIIFTSQYHTKKRQESL